MADPKGIQRKLWFDGKKGREALAQDELLTRTEPLVILGEAGMGKTHLLQWLSSFPGISWCKARQLINRVDPRTLYKDGTILVIDALDEVSAQKEGTAVDLVLQRLGAIGYPRFILSCRVSDWRSSTGLETIREQYSENPIELHLEPFNLEDAVLFLKESLGEESAQRTIEHFKNKDLEGLLGNPQTLSMVSAVVAKLEILPESKSDLYERAIDVLRIEHNSSHADMQFSKEALESAAGAAFAGLILTGNEAISRAATAHIAEGEIPLAEVSMLPKGEGIGKSLSARLYNSFGADRFTYSHRSIGEFLGAYWLSKVADTKRKRRRLLNLLQGHGLVPASIRGIHAWLARDPALAGAVIALDPMGVIEYGDADGLDVGQARLLLDTLEKLANENPMFRGWGPYSLKAIARPELLTDLRRIMLAKETPFFMRLLVVEAVRNAAVAADLLQDLHSIIISNEYEFANRKAAGLSISSLIGNDEWARIGLKLNDNGDDVSARLAIELMDDIGYEAFSNELIADFVISFSKQENQVSGPLYYLERSLPDSRLDGFLDALSAKQVTPDENDHIYQDSEITGFANYLVVRRLRLRPLSAEKFLAWLTPFQNRMGYRQEVTKALDEIVLKDASLRRAIQRIVFIEKEKDHNFLQTEFLLGRISIALRMQDEDAVALLEQLNPKDMRDDRWRAVTTLVFHDETRGLSVRTAAMPFANGDAEVIGWINGLAVRRIDASTIQEEADAKKRKEEESKRRADFRRDCIDSIDKIRNGDQSVLIKVAKCYMKRFSDVAPGIEGLLDWLGQDICNAVLEGFEAYLHIDPPPLTAKAIADATVEGKWWHAEDIISAGLIERNRTHRGLLDISDEMIIAGYLISIERGARGHRELEPTIHEELLRRGIFEAAVRMCIEPQLEKRCTHVSALYSVMSDERISEIAENLAEDWLKRFPESPRGVESELITKLLRTGRTDALKSALSVKKQKGALSLDWLAVGLIVDLKTTAAELVMTDFDRNLLWSIRSYSGPRLKEERSLALSADFIEWVITTFRSYWPMTDRGYGDSDGDKNDYDASEYLAHLIRRLGSNFTDPDVSALRRIVSAPEDGYTELAKATLADQSKSRVESAYVPPTLAELMAISKDGPPQSILDLQGRMIEELEIAQAKIISDDAESWRGFYSSTGSPNIEEHCRDHLLGILRQESEGITLTPEQHVSGDKEVDIGCSVGKIRLPIEVKGQWNKDLWHGADTQLDRLYTVDWQAERRGIYLVLWFGKQKGSKALKSPGRGTSSPESPESLREMLHSRSRAAQDGRVKIFVLDVSRP